MSKKWKFYAKVRYESLHDLVVALRLDIVRVGRLVGLPENQAPTLLQYKQHGRFRPYFLIARILGKGEFSWVDAVRELGFDAYKYDKRSDRDDVAMEMDRLGRQEFPSRPGYGPSLVYFRTHSRLTTSAAFRIVGTKKWKEVVRHFGRVPADNLRRMGSEEEVVKDVRRVARLVGHPELMPTPTQYNQHGKWSNVTLVSRMAPPDDQTWSAVAEICGLRARRRRKGAGA